MNIGFEAKRVFHNKTGLGNYSRDLVRILSEYLPKNNYFLYNPNPSVKYRFIPNETNVFEKLPSNQFYKIFKNLWRQYFIINDLKKDNIDVFHGLSGEIPFSLKYKNIKKVVTIHDLIYMKFPELYSFWDRKIHYYKQKRAAQNADIVIAVSQQTKNDIVEFFGIDPLKIDVIHQGCHPVFKKSFSELEKFEVLEKYKIPYKFILNVGTIEARKNVLLVVKALKNNDAFLVIIGKSTFYAEEVRQYILVNNLENRVLFLSGISNNELAIIYQKATIFVYPSFYEGFGIPIIEALYSKTPVITTAGGVFPEAGGENSIYINPNSVEEMETAILKLWNNKNLRNQIAEDGFNFVQKFNDEHIASKVGYHYINLLKKN